MQRSSFAAKKTPPFLSATVYVHTAATISLLLTIASTLSIVLDAGIFVRIALDSYIYIYDMIFKTLML